MAISKDERDPTQSSDPIKDPEEALDEWLERNEFDRIFFPDEPAIQAKDFEDHGDLVLGIEGLLAIPEREQSLAFFGQFNPKDNTLLRTCFRLRSLDFFFENIHDNPIATRPNKGDDIRSWIYDLTATETIDDETVVRFQQEIEDQLSHVSDREDLYESILERKVDDVRYWMENLMGPFTSGRTAFMVRAQLFEAIRDWSPTENTEPPSTDPESDDESEEQEDDGPALTVSTRCDPHSGIPVDELQPGDSIIVQLVGDQARTLPDHLRDSEANHPKSIPLVGTIQTIQESPDAGDAGESLIQGRLNEGVQFRSFVHKNDRLKTPGDDPEPSSEDLSDFLPIGILVLLLLVVILLVVFL